MSGSSAASTASRTNAVAIPGVDPGHAPGARFVTERDEHPVGRALERGPADDRADGDDRDARRAPVPHELADRPGEDRADRDDRVRRPDDDDLGRGERAAMTAAVGRRGRRRSGLRGPPAPGGDGRSTPGSRASPRRRGPGSGPARRPSAGSASGCRARPAASARPSVRSRPVARAARSGRCASRSPGRRAGTSPPRRSRPGASITVQVSPAMPQPRSSSNRPASMYMTASWSGITSRPCRSVSSPVLTMTVSSPGARTACRPCASFAPPVPPARATTFTRSRRRAARRRAPSGRWSRGRTARASGR